MAIDKEMLPDGVDDDVVHRDIDGLGVEEDVAHFLFADLAIFVRHDHAAAIVETPDVSAADARKDIVHLNPRAILRRDDGVLDILHGRFDVDDLAFAHAFRSRLTDSDHLNVAAVEHFADDRAHLRGAHFQPYDDAFFCQHVAESSCSSIDECHRNPACHGQVNGLHHFLTLRRPSHDRAQAP